MACVYCDFHAHKSQSATRVLAALLKQLVAGVEPIPKEINEAFERAKGKVDGRALRLPEIHTIFIKSVTSLRRGFICIDALDEFPMKHRPGLWDSLQYIARKCPNIRLFITGRPHIRAEVPDRQPSPSLAQKPPLPPLGSVPLRPLVASRELLTLQLQIGIYALGSHSRNKPRPRSHQMYRRVYLLRESFCFRT